MRMRRSLSRTEETSGLVTMIALSAKYSAVTAPCSIPAGLSQMMKSNCCFSSSSTRSTPSRFNASLSRVCEVGKMYRLSLRLSLISAWLRLASPLMTLMKSNTTRRSQPITKSRLRNPTSKSMTTVLWPRSASPAAKAAAVVVFPTPPLPDVIATTFANKSSLPLAAPGLVILRSPYPCAQPPSRSSALIFCYRQLVIDERDLDCRTVLFRRQLLADKIPAGDADQLGFEPRAEDSRLDVAAGAGQSPAAQHAINMNVAVGNELGAWADRGRDDEVGAAGVDLRPRPHRLGNQTRRRPGRLSGWLGGGARVGSHLGCTLFIFSEPRRHR